MIVSIHCLHHKCVKAKFLDFEFAKELFAYPEFESSNKLIYDAYCYLTLSHGKTQKMSPQQLERLFKDFLTKNELYANVIDFYGVLPNRALYFRLALPQANRNKEEESLIWALHKICAVGKRSIRVLHVYQDPDPRQGHPVEAVYFEECRQCLDYDKLVAGFAQLGEGTYKIIRPRTKKDLMIDRSSELEQLASPTTKLELIKSKIERKEGLSNDELSEWIFVQRFTKRRFVKMPGPPEASELRIEKEYFRPPRNMVLNVADANRNLLHAILSNPILEETREKSQLQSLLSEYEEYINELKKS